MTPNKVKEEGVTPHEVIKDSIEKCLQSPPFKRVIGAEMSAIITGRLPEYTSGTTLRDELKEMQLSLLLSVKEMVDNYIDNHYFCTAEDLQSLLDEEISKVKEL